MWMLKCTPFYYMLAEPAALLLHLRSIVCQTYFCSPVRGRKDRNERVAHETSPLWQALHKKKIKKNQDNVETHLATHTFTQFIWPQHTLVNNLVCTSVPLLRFPCANSEAWTNEKPAWQELVEWLQRRRRRKKKNKQIAREGEGPWLLTKCPPDVVGLLPAPRLMAPCVSTLPMGGKG